MRLWLLVLSGCVEALDPSDFAPPAQVAAMARVDAPLVTGTPVVGTGDLDGDGHIDRVVESGASLQVMYNDGQGGLVAGPLLVRPTVDAGARYSFAGTQVGDYDGDGYADVFDWVGFYAPGIDYPINRTRVRVAYGSSTGISPQPIPTIEMEITAANVRFLGDGNGDGATEIALEFMNIGWSYNEYWFELDFQDPSEIVPYTRVGGWAFGGWWDATFRFHGGLVPIAVAGDLNGDDLADELVAADGPYGLRWRAGVLGEDHDTPYVVATDWPLDRYGDPVVVHSWIPDWTWSPPPEPYGELWTDLRGAAAQGVGDVNDDGFGDLVVIERVGYPHLPWFAGGPDGPGAVQTGTLLPDSSDLLSVEGVAGADFDGDGAREIVALVTTRANQPLLMFFAPVPGESRPLRVLAVDGAPTTLRAAGDANSDGAEDLFVGDQLVFGGPVVCPGGPAQRWYLDSDADGYASSAHAVVVCAQPPGASALPGGDCNDVNAAVHPGAAESLGHGDTNCDGAITVAIDLDHDGYGTALVQVHAYDCGVSGCLGRLGDCDDANFAVHPTARELAGALVDLNCDGVLTCYVDLDGDGVGTTSRSYTGPTCAAPAAGVAPVSGDCDDHDAQLGALATLYRDADHDGWGVYETVADRQTLCAQAGWAPATGDCNDASAVQHPGATEVPGGSDEDCDGYGDCYIDDDGDEYAANPTLLYTLDATCGGPALAAQLGDCDDHDARRHPGQPELLGGPDEDCDGVTLCGPEVPGGGDENCDGLGDCFLDGDGDGYGGAGVVQTADVFCAGAGIAGLPDDCDDADPRRSPGRTEVLGGLDEDCDGAGLCYLDADQDGAAGDLTLYAAQDATCTAPGLALRGGDCDDTDPAFGPYANDLRGNFLDENCDGQLQCFSDLDGDGHGGYVRFFSPVGQACGAGYSDNTDCDDAEPTVHDGAPEVPGNGTDEDCNSQDTFRITTASYMRYGRLIVRVTLSGLPPSTPAYVYASRQNTFGHGPCPMAGQPCGELVRPYLFATGVTDAAGVLIVRGVAPSDVGTLQGFALVRGRLGRTVVGGVPWL